MKIRTMAAGVTAAVMLASGASLMLAPGASATPAHGHACTGKSITVPAGTKVDGEKVKAGTYVLGVEGISCAKARRAIAAAIDGEALLAGFEADSQHPGDVALELVNHEGSSDNADDATIVLAKAAPLSGSTVTLVNNSDEPVLVETNSGRKMTVEPGSSMTDSRKASGDSTDVVLNLRYPPSATRPDAKAVIKTQSCWILANVWGLSTADGWVNVSGACSNSGEPATCSFSKPSVGAVSYCTNEVGNSRQREMTIERVANDGSRYSYVVTLKNRR